MILQSPSKEVAYFALGLSQNLLRKREFFIGLFLDIEKYEGSIHGSDHYVKVVYRKRTYWETVEVAYISKNRFLIHDDYSSCCFTLCLPKVTRTLARYIGRKYYKRYVASVRKFKQLMLNCLELHWIKKANTSDVASVKNVTSILRVYDIVWEPFIANNIFLHSSVQ